MYLPIWYLPATSDFKILDFCHFGFVWVLLSDLASVIIDPLGYKISSNLIIFH